MSAPALPHVPLSTQHKDPRRGRGLSSPAPTVAGEEEALPGGCEQMSLGVTLTDRLMAARSFPGLGETMRPESCSEELPALQTIRLDREDICTIGRLGSLPGIHSLYLQRNQIEKIENLDCFPNLQFLSLAGNCIRKVENLRPLQHLRFLDLSQNQIQTLDADELPRSLRLLDLTGNECTHQPGYRELVVGALPHLLQQRCPD
ncbi:leucine-rich repeat-containing protein 46 [Phasianus colchicus]|uniref:leucine-rich repeat-containing protein 46 n=1 Tax=Phasianus colchicus TaxID=9054 RepID=UPI00129E549E|nr:leucine-rich repeat-containing protein 46 [Phasianus colchicus]